MSGGPDGAEPAAGARGTFRREGAPGPERLVAAPGEAPVRLLASLAAAMPEPFLVIYVLLRSGTFRPEGRWQASQPVSGAELRAFLDRFEGFLSGDGRHALWIVPTSAPVGVALDRRGAVTVHGEVGPAVPLLEAAGLVEGPAAPGPAREALPEHDREENALLAWWPWTWYALEPGDDAED